MNREHRKPIALVAAIACGIAAFYSLSIHWLLSNHEYRAARYSGSIGGAVMALVDSIFIFAAAATLGAQLSV